MGDLGRALVYLRPYGRTTLGAFISLIIVTVTNLVSPQILQTVIDQGISKRNTPVIIGTALALLGVAAVRSLFSFFQGYLIERASQGAAFDLRNAIFTKLESLSFSYYDKAQTGQLMTRATNDVEAVRTFTGATFLQLLNALLLLIGSATILLLTNWQLALVALAIVPVIMVIFLVFFQRVGPRFRIIQQKLGGLNTILQENLAGVRVIKAFVREPYELQRYTSANTNLLDETMSASRTTSIVFPAIFFVANLGTLGVIWIGGGSVINGTFTVGALVAFNSYLAFLLQPVFILGGTIANIAQSSASARRVFEVLDAPIEVADKPDAITLTKVRGQVTFDHVAFRYPGTDTQSLTDVSFVVQPGQTVAVLGRTGAGKSTLIELIPRFYDVTGGRVLIDDYDVRDVTLTSLRAQIGIVLQDVTLFSGSIRDNIAYGKPDATDVEIEAAAQAAQATDFITALPDGYATIIGERGIGLSGGQRQRIAIARTLLLDPALLILDDSTSSVDAETEYQIQQALQKLLDERTAFIIAQRISTVRTADTILLLDGGRLVAQGTHDQLLRESGLYCELVESQLVGDLVEAVS